jgi:hypothetical protein
MYANDPFALVNGSMTSENDSFVRVKGVKKRGDGRQEARNEGFRAARDSAAGDAIAPCGCMVSPLLSSPLLSSLSRRRRAPPAARLFLSLVYKFSISY